MIKSAYGARLPQTAWLTEGRSSLKVANAGRSVTCSPSRCCKKCSLESIDDFEYEETLGVICLASCPATRTGWPFFGSCRSGRLEGLPMCPSRMRCDDYFRLLVGPLRALGGSSVIRPGLSRRHSSRLGPIVDYGGMIVLAHFFVCRQCRRRPQPSRFSDCGFNVPGRSERSPCRWHIAVLC